MKGKPKLHVLCELELYIMNMKLGPSDGPNYMFMTVMCLMADVFYRRQSICHLKVVQLILNCP